MDKNFIPPGTPPENEVDTAPLEAKLKAVMDRLEALRQADITAAYECGKVEGAREERERCSHVCPGMPVMNTDLNEIDDIARKLQVIRMEAIRKECPDTFNEWFMSEEGWHSVVAARAEAVAVKEWLERRVAALCSPAVAPKCEEPHIDGYEGCVTPVEPACYWCSPDDYGAHPLMYDYELREWGHFDVAWHRCEVNRQKPAPATLTCDDCGRAKCALRFGPRKACDNAFQPKVAPAKPHMECGNCGYALDNAKLCGNPGKCWTGDGWKPNAKSPNGRDFKTKDCWNCGWGLHRGTQCGNPKGKNECWSYGWSYGGWVPKVCGP